jgi:LacI family transcriptional regulator
MSSSIRDVAASAGVSLATVSQVLNGRENARIAPATQERVRRAAQELNYQPNRLARSLITGRTDTIGMMISGFRNPFFVQLLESMEQTDWGGRVSIAAGCGAIVSRFLSRAW